MLGEQAEQMEPERGVSLKCCAVWFHQGALGTVLACSQAMLHHLAWGTKDHCLAEASRTVKYSNNIFRMGLCKRLIQAIPFWLPVFRKRTLKFRRIGSLKSHLIQPKSDVL